MIIVEDVYFAIGVAISEMGQIVLAKDEIFEKYNPDGKSECIGMESSTIIEREDYQFYLTAAWHNVTTERQRKMKDLSQSIPSKLKKSVPGMPLLKEFEDDKTWVLQMLVGCKYENLFVDLFDINDEGLMNVEMKLPLSTEPPIKIFGPGYSIENSALKVHAGQITDLGNQEIHDYANYAKRKS